MMEPLFGTLSCATPRRALVAGDAAIPFQRQQRARNGKSAAADTPTARPVHTATAYHALRSSAEGSITKTSTSRSPMTRATVPRRQMTSIALR